MARILLADDDRGALDLVRRALEMDGHAVTTADDGNEALAHLGRATFDVLVTDVQMPGLDGIALAKAAVAQRPGLKMVMMSGYPDILEKAREINGVTLRLVAKPFPIEHIRKEIRELLAE